MVRRADDKALGVASVMIGHDRACAAGCSGSDNQLLYRCLYNFRWHRNTVCAKCDDLFCYDVDLQRGCSGDLFSAFSQWRYQTGIYRELAGLSCRRYASFIAYGIVLWACFSARIALVSSLRETSVLFAVGLGTILLGGRLTIFKNCLTLVILAGIIFLRLG